MPTPGPTPLEQLAAHILAKGNMSREEYSQLSVALSSEVGLTATERRQVNRVFDYIQTGRLTVEL